jgi:hypothetical protein
MSRLAHARLRSARAPRAGFGIAPKRTSPRYRLAAKNKSQRKVRDREDALAKTRGTPVPKI